ncbi:hypothetical protein DPMN_078426 [Dreissena polymorpha]|uniref:Uncharacterized protein n=1 Tax=Dreissena polymorpha TaxID=45954 RepID=A0A9D3YQJ2_DREPO|nr:hypothetical protein DPMN_078426 [Dreissena polymorpha]
MNVLELYNFDDIILNQSKHCVDYFQEVINNANSNPLQLIAAGYHISNPIFELMKETPVTSCECMF